MSVAFTSGVAIPGQVVTAQTDPLTGGIEISAGDAKLNRQLRTFTQKHTLPAIERFGAVADWSVTNSGATAAASSGAGLLGTGCINIAAPAQAGQSAYITQDQTFNLSAHNGFWLILRNNYRQAAAGLGLTTYLAQSTGLGTGVGRWSCASLPPARAVSVQPHWVPKSAFSVLDGAPNFANDILSWRFRIDSNASEQKDVDFLGVVLGGQRPTVTISFDDGWATAYNTAHTLARKREIPLVHYLIASKIGAGGYITAAQAREMVASGDQLGLHGLERWDQDVTRIASDYAALVALLGDVSDFDHAAYPEGQIGDGVTWQATKAALEAVGAKTARLAGSTGEPTLLGYTDPMALTSYPLNNTLSLANAQAAVDTAIASGGTVHFYGHKIDAAADALTWTTSDYTALLDYIVAKRNAGALDVKTIKKWHDQLTEI